MRTSALNGTGIEELFDELVEKYLKEVKGQILEENKNDKKKDENIKINGKTDKKDKKGLKC